MRLINQVVMVTGASSGLGRAVALQAAAEGATVVLLARRKPQLQRVQALASAASGRPAYAFTVDIGDPTAIDAVVARVQEQVGTVDILVNAAGFGHFQAALDTEPALVARMFRVNTLGTMYLTQRVGRQMVAAGRGHIVMIASMAGKMATPKSAVYSATKAAVIGYADGLRLELRPLGVRVTTVNPGPINTEFFKAADALSYQQSIQGIALDPERLARRIVASFNRPVREINAPGLMAAAAFAYRLAPRVGDWLAGGVFNRK